MSYKIKVKPEDFIVKELSSIEIEPNGVYAVFLLKKRGWNTVDVIKKISQKYKIPFEDISYGGKKDRHAVTEQFITIKNTARNIKNLFSRFISKDKLSGQFEVAGKTQNSKNLIYQHIVIKEENYELKFLGFCKQPMDPKFIDGNLFKVTVRAISPRASEMIQSQVEKTKTFGFINYFDDQRFGSFDPKQGFIAEKIIKEHYNGALKIYLTHIYPEDKKEAKERKRYLFENWSNWKLCLDAAKTKFEKFAFNHLLDNPKDFLTVIRKIPREELSMFFSAYQAFLWNDVVRRLLCKILNSDNLLAHRGIAGQYIFFNEIDEKNYEYLKNLKIPTVSSKAQMPDKLTEEIYSSILESVGIRPSMFNLRKIRQAFFKSVERAVIVVPTSINYRIEDDELYDGRKKLIVGFMLPRGCYATMLIKRIFAKRSK